MFLAASALTAVMAWPVLRHPSGWTVGNEIAGRYRDPFVVMQQYGAGSVPAPYVQPATDLPGIALARRVGGVAAYNLLDLLSFPLAAVTAYLLAWKLTGSRLASAVAALALAWSPFHVAQASYHLHVAQIQWLPALLLAVWMFAERPSVMRLVVAGGCAMVAAASSFYWALIVAVMLPVALVASAALVTSTVPRRRRVTIAVALAAAVIAAAVAAVVLARLLLPGDLDQHAAAAGDASVYAAVWWHYLLPPIDHPLVGPWVRSRFAGSGAAWALLDQQVGPGWSILLLAGAGAAIGLRQDRWRGPVLWLLTLASVAIVCSVQPGAAILAAIAPMFRAFARFSGVVAVCVAVLAGIGARGLWDLPPRRWVAAVLLALAVIELRPAATRARDILPTEGYRWLANRGGDWRVLDCTAPGREYGASVAVAVGTRVGFRELPFGDCAEPGLAGKLSRYRFTHLLLRASTREGRWIRQGGSLRGLARVAETRDDEVLEVLDPPSAVFISGTTGFHIREFDGARTWQWMPREAQWRVMNPSARPIAMVLEIQGEAAGGPRDLEAWIAGARVAGTRIEGNGWHALGPLTFPAGETALAFHVPQGDAPADLIYRNGDPRPIAVRFDDWRWAMPAAGAGR